jgi:ABC-type sugar transport system substrate-binding protein
MTTEGRRDARQYRPVGRQRRRTSGVLAIVCAGAALVTVFGSGSASAATRASCPAYTTQQVQAATKGRAITPIYAVPTCIKNQHLVLGFINPSLEYPFFKTWSDGYKAAAKFYGVKIVENDINFKWEDTVPRFDQLKALHPAVVGTLTTAGAALKRAADSAHIPLLPIDLTIPGNPYFLGVPNKRAGTLAGAYIGKIVKQQMAGPWNGKKLVYVGLDNPTCAPCHERVVSALAAVQKFVPIADSDATQLNVTVAGDSSNGRVPFTDFLTAHPGDVMVVVGLNDEVADGALQAINAAGRAGDVKMISLGGDSLGRSDLRKFPNVLVAALDFNPYAEAWNWVEGAIAITQHKKFKYYQVNNFLTPANVNTFYPHDSN